MNTQDLTKDTKGEIVIYQSEEGRVSVDVLFQDETVWLPIEQMSILFGKSRSTINEHILNIYKEGELSEADTVRKIGISDFSTQPTTFTAQYKNDTGTGIDNIEQPSLVGQKILREGTLYILVGDRIYDATGKLVK